MTNLTCYTFRGLLVIAWTLLTAMSTIAQESRIDAPDLMLTPAGKLVRSHQNRYDEVGYIDEIDKINLNRIGTRRTKDDYNKGFRDWGWGDL